MRNCLITIILILNVLLIALLLSDPKAAVFGDSFPKVKGFFLKTFQERNGLIVMLATVIIAFATYKGMQISAQLADLQERVANQDKLRLQAELRPYIVPQLIADAANLKRDGQSRMFLSLYDSKFLIVPMMFTNVGKLPALNPAATYSSPSQNNVPWDLGDNVVLPEAQPTALYRPWVNISTIVNGQDKDPFNIFLKMTYRGNEDIDPRVYYSLLKLEIQRREEGSYEIINKDFRFGYE